MAPADSTALIQRAIRLGLITEFQKERVLEDLGTSSPDIDSLIRSLEGFGYITSWQTSKLKNGEDTGYLLGGFRILYKIASGSFGRVFRADDPRTGRNVAIKVLRRRHTEKQERIDYFYREGKLGMTLKHPNIVEILAVSHDAPTGQYFIVMEFVEGGNLREILEKRKQFTLSEALAILDDAASGLAHAYSQGMTHRDIKLSNILISVTKAAKLVDFGLAQLFSAMGGEEKDRVERTVDYAGLEKATNVKPGDVRSDIYFLGCVLYEIISGRPPFPLTRDKNSRMQRQRFDNVVPFANTDVVAPPSVYALVNTMMALDPQQRFQTPSQLVDAIRNARREVDGRAGSTQGFLSNTGRSASPVTTRTLFVAESDIRLQEVMRERFKGLGFRVLLASDPKRALDRFRQQPFDALVVDAGTVGLDGIRIFDQIMTDAERQRISCAGVVLLNEDQADLQSTIKNRPNTAILVQKITFKQLQKKLEELLAIPASH